MLHKPLEKITADNIRALVEECRPESFDLEFKSGVPAEKGGPDPWVQKGEVGNYARGRLLREIVAFANSQGGTLIIGVGETGDEPKRAAELTPLPRCHELARRIEAMVRDDIEPRLIDVRVAGIETAGDGSGVVIVRVSASPIAPHWVASSRDATIRRGAHSVGMTMTEIQDMTLQLSRTAQAIERSFEEAHERFDREFRRYAPVLQESLHNRIRGKNLDVRAGGLSVVALPIASVVLPNAAVDSSFRLDPPRLNISWAEGPPELVGPDLAYRGRWRSILRGASLEEREFEFRHHREIGERGRIEIDWMDAHADSPGGPSGFRLDWLLWTCAFALLWIEHLRVKHGLPDLPFGMSITVRCNGWFIPTPTDRPKSFRSGEKLPEALSLPDYRVGGRDSFDLLLAVISQDLFNAAGIEASPTFSVDMSSGFAKIDQ